MSVAWQPDVVRTEIRAGVAHWGSSVAPAGTAPIPGMLIVDWGFAVVRRARGRRERTVRRVGGCMVGCLVGLSQVLAVFRMLQSLLKVGG